MNSEENVSNTNNVCQNETPEMKDPAGPYMKKRPVKKWPPAALLDLEQVILEEGYGKYASIYIRGNYGGDDRSFKKLIIRGYKGADFYGEILDRFVKEELSSITGGKDKFEAEIMRAGKYKHVFKASNDKWSANDDLSDKIFSRSIILWEDESVYGTEHEENEFQKSMEVLGAHYSGDGYLLELKVNE